MTDRDLLVCILQNQLVGLKMQRHSLLPHEHIDVGGRATVIQQRLDATVDIIRRTGNIVDG